MLHLLENQYSVEMILSLPKIILTARLKAVNVMNTLTDTTPATFDEIFDIQYGPHYYTQLYVKSTKHFVWQAKDRTHRPREHST